MTIAVARHVESVTESGAASAVVTRQGVVESHRIHHREWNRIVAVNTACQGVMKMRRVLRREWSRIVAVNTACQGVQACRSKFGQGVWRRGVASYPPERGLDAANPIERLRR